MSTYEINTIILQKDINFLKNQDFKNNENLDELLEKEYNPEADKNKLISKNENILKKLKNQKDIVLKPFPKYIMKDHKIIKKKFNKIKEEDNKSKNNYENKYDFIEKIMSDEDNEYKCSSLTSSYTRCKQKVLYIYTNLNEPKENNKKKFNVPLCKRHTDMILNSEDKKTLKYGFYFESDLYKD